MVQLYNDIPVQGVLKYCISISDFTFAPLHHCTIAPFS